ncbi:MAG: hypothetical protein A4E19_16875 [Nitrospira sp. SG-bin1]|nr:MAG: hypothetical protein A4E19_16875 [Nitrospira sp. SG-bin1]
MADFQGRVDGKCWLSETTVPRSVDKMRPKISHFSLTKKVLSDFSAENGFPASIPILAQSMLKDLDDRESS